ncbi:BRD4-interacting chromatin-remodeling complex-associated protein-like [Vitis riparia]|uniref:BRD4-interacting chromatin-remodeling complex-associated protein-like n=1 Tax=Vitis riparia TaxID=96939 RepID=UPI00155A07E1|nr:BRD4-interacting chromatin-remodeling complex-associated protein-like [Vitis riparia]
MAKTRGAHVMSPSTRNPRLRASLARDSTSEAPHASTIPPSEGGVPSSPPQRRLLCQILEHLGYPSEPQLEHCHIFRELFTLDKWNHLTTYVAPRRAPDMPIPLELPQDEQPPQAQHAKIPIEIIPPAPAAPLIVPTPEATSSTLPTTSKAPLIVPATSSPSPSDSSITISSSEFKVIRARQDQLIAMQTQHTTILRQIQQHLGILPPPEYDMPGPSKPTAPSEVATPAEQTIPHEETTTVKVETPIQSTQETTAEPSSPHDPPTTT